MAYAETSMSRRKFLLHYFGEEYDEVNGPGAQNCDNMTNPPKLRDGQEEVHLILSAVLGTNKLSEPRSTRACSVAKKTAKSRTTKAPPVRFGNGVRNTTTLEWHHSANARARVVAQRSGTFGVLKITDRGMDFLTNPSPVMVAEERDYSDVDAMDSMSGAFEPGGAADVKLRDMLKALRKEVADDESLPPYVIFQDVSLDEMAIHYPLNEDELLRITGVGSGKAKKYSTPFLKLIADYVKEEGIERAEDLLVRSTSARSSSKSTSSSASTGRSTLLTSLGT